MTRVVGLLLFGIAACGSKADKPKVDPKAAVGFTSALSELAGIDPTQSASLIAQGAYQTVAPSEKCFESFAAAATERARVEALLDCGLACTLEAIQGLKGKEPRAWMAHLAGACQPTHFGLETSNAAMLSAEWFLLHKIGQIAAPHIEAASGADRDALDKALAGFRLPLPLPAVASNLYELPVALAEASEPVASPIYVIVPSRGARRVGATPYATLDRSGARMTAPDGQVLFPGNESEDVAGAVRDAAGPSATRAIPLLLADARRPAVDVLDAVASLPAVRVGVAAQDDPGARALAAEVSVLVPGSLGAEGIELISVAGNAPWSDVVAQAVAATASGADRIALVAAQAGGDGDRTVIGRVLQANVDTLSVCHKRVLKQNPSLMGRVNLSFTVAADGSLTDVKATGFDEVEDCVVERLKLIKFPKPKAGPVEVRYPVVFEAKD